MPADGDLSPIAIINNLNSEQISRMGARVLVAAKAKASLGYMRSWTVAVDRMASINQSSFQHNLQIHVLSFDDLRALFLQELCR